MRRLRTGRHNKQIVYAQLGDEPADTDPMVAVFFNPVQAALILAVVNAAADTEWFNWFGELGE